ncbi:hypothetical protein OH799_33920 [Nocardia sp. NBC_00881]|uniref:hypothetical protein n=1 Tax=Nocardia sp. NBC_00881 TaxID=2975995 RepID=UPI003870441B|nr:hypothetical protein OH799_33920 [Nocardia sp. NBC_00881]
MRQPPSWQTVITSASVGSSPSTTAPATTAGLPRKPAPDTRNIAAASALAPAADILRVGVWAAAKKQMTAAAAAVISLKACTR